MALRELFARFGFEFDKAKLKEADSSVNRLKQGAEAAIAVFAGSAILNATKHFAEQLDVLDDLSAQTGIATDQLQVFGYAAELSGSSAEEMNNSLTLLQKSLGRTTEATGPQVDALKALGIQFKDASGAPRELADVLPDIFANFKNLKSGAEKAMVANSLFGRSGVRLIPTLEKGAEGLAELRGELDEFGGVVGDDAIKSAGEFRDNIARMDRALFSLKGRFATAVFPQLSKIVVALGKGVGKLSDWIKNTTLAETATKALAVSVGVKLASALAPYLGAGLKFAGIFLAVDDVIGFLEGKDSLIGRLLDRAFGEGTQATVRDWVNNAIANFGRFHASAAETFAAIENEALPWTTRLTAIMFGFFRDAIAGFPLWRSSFTSTLLDVEISFREFVAKITDAWNGFLVSLKLPPVVLKAIGIDSTGNQEALSNAEFAARTEAEKRIGLRAGFGTGPAKGSSGERVGTTVTAEQADAFKQSAKFTAPLLTGNVAPPTFAPLLAPQTTITEAPINVAVNLPAGTDPRDARTVGNAVGSAVRDASSNRTARQALVQRK